MSNGWKWGITFVLFLATVLTYLDRQTVSLCGPMLSAELHLSNEQFGNLLASFRWAYALAQAPAGFLADRFAIQSLYALAVSVWSLAGAAAAFAGNLKQLMATRAVLGLGEAFNWPCASRIVADLFSSKDRGLASGIFNSGAAIGSLIAPLVITPIAIRYGWRRAFLLIGALGAGWLALWIFRTRPGTRAASLSNRVRAADVAATGIFRRPGFWMLAMVAVTINPCWYFLNEWIPKYMHDQRGMGYLAAGIVTIPIFLGADFGNLASGGLIKLLVARGWPLGRARGFTMSIAVALILPVAFMTDVKSARVAIGLMALAGAGITSIVANYTACQQDFSFAHVGLVSGVLGMSANAFSAFADPLIGRYVDRTGNYELIFILVALLPAISLAGILIFDRIIGAERD